MDDKFLYDARQEPPPEFARELRERLQRQGPDRSDQVRPPLLARLRPAWGGVTAVLVVAALFFIPSVRASAQAFLDLFRVRNFAAVTIDPARLEQLRGQKLDVESILGHPEMLRDPGPVRAFTNAQDAASATGYTLRLATDAPSGLKADTTFVRGEAVSRLHVDATQLRTLLTSLALDDVEIPPGIDGAEVNLRVPPVARTVYRNEKRKVMLLQAPSPEMSLPPGVDIARLGEIGLRVAGLSASEARRLAQSIDWHSTLLVPVPPDAATFREVDVRGRKGLLVTLGEHPGPSARARMRRTGSQLMWSDGERVYALVSDSVRDMDLVQMANSVQ